MLAIMQTANAIAIITIVIENTIAWRGQSTTRSAFLSATNTARRSGALCASCWTTGRCCAHQKEDSRFADARTRRYLSPTIFVSVLRLCLTLLPPRSCFAQALLQTPQPCLPLPSETLETKSLLRLSTAANRRLPRSAPSIVARRLFQTVRAICAVHMLSGM